jgi:hypothetical protein
MLNYLQNNPLCALLVGIVALALGYLFAKDGCNKKEDIHPH